MAHEHTFDCQLCGAHLDTARELDEHTRDKHPAQSASSASSSGKISSRENEARENRRINDLERL